MEDIDVVKKGSMAWLWIVIALAAILVVMWFTMGGGDGTPATGQLRDLAEPRASAIHMRTA
jgi:hypothetical protein